ncbi:MAG: metallophosphoesterase family protein [Chloroflexi bacterium]|nr:metallophosphoesterase family protein [Chloroflexota bacterium]
MRIGLISDTHIPEAGRTLPLQVFEAFAGVDLVLHAGDLHDLAVLDWLEVIAPVRGARGNGEDGSGGRPVRPHDSRLPPAQVFEALGVRIGVVHDLPLPERPPHHTFEAMMEREFGGPVDVLVCGHTHVEGIEMIRGTLVVNPGSATLPHNLEPQLGTVGLLEIDEAGVLARIVPLWDLAWNDEHADAPPVPPVKDRRFWRHGGAWHGRWPRAAAL